LTKLVTKYYINPLKKSEKKIRSENNEIFYVRPWIGYDR
jgi:hypothetical protein